LPKIRVTRGAGVGKLTKTLAIGRGALRATRLLLGAGVMMYLVPPLKMWEWAVEIGFRLFEVFQARQHEEERESRRKQQALRCAIVDNAGVVEQLMTAKVVSDAQYQALVTAWDRNRKIAGFVYARLNVLIEQEVFRGPMYKEIEDLTRYRAVTVDLGATSAYHDFELTGIGDEHQVELTASDRSYLDGAIRKGFYYVGKQKWIQRYRLKYTIQTPAITPFDIALMKVNNLFMDLLTFAIEFQTAKPVLEHLTQMDYSAAGYEEMIGGPLEFPKPLNRSVCHYCLSYLHWVGSELSTHHLRQADLEGNLEAPRRGWERRRDVLWRLLVGRGSTKHGLNFAYFAEQMGKIVSEPLDDPELQSSATELYSTAYVVLSDLRRIDNLQTNPEYYYFGPSYRPSSK
jgi:hypothetical protein